jgi:3-(methylthio)propanoyl-CoA dehydrogenase
MIEAGESGPPRALAGAVPYLKLLGNVAGGWLMAKAALAAQARLANGAADAAFSEAKLRTARFYAEHVLAVAPGLVPAVTGGSTVMAFDLDQL